MNKIKHQPNWQCPLLRQARLLGSLAKPVDLRLRRVDGLPVLYENLDDINIHDGIYKPVLTGIIKRLLSLFFNSKHYKHKRKIQKQLSKVHRYGATNRVSSYLSTCNP